MSSPAPDTFEDNYANLTGQITKAESQLAKSKKRLAQAEADLKKQQEKVEREKEVIAAAEEELKTMMASRHQLVLDQHYPPIAGDISVHEDNNNTSHNSPRAFNESDGDHHGESGLSWALALIDGRELVDDSLLLTGMTLRQTAFQ